MGWLIPIAMGLGLCAGVTYVLIYWLHIVPYLRAQSNAVVPTRFADNCRKYYEVRGSAGRALKAVMIALWTWFFLAWLTMAAALVWLFLHSGEINRSTGPGQ